MHDNAFPAADASSQAVDSTALKVMKKKQKKERQKEKKNGPKAKAGTATANDANVCEVATPMEKKDLAEKSDVDRLDNNDTDGSIGEESDDTESSDIDFLTDAPAFVKSSIVSKNDTAKMLKKINDGAKGSDSSAKDANHAPSKVMADETGGFTCVKKGSKQAPAIFCKTPEDFGIHALRVIRLGNFPLAIEYLSRAIDLDPADTRHYINRSYCYLRMGDYTRALEDIQFTSERFTDITEMARAKCREGQVLCGLQNYEAAEEAFRRCLQLMPNCPYAKRELKRMQVMQLVSMGFKERNAILALEKQPYTMDAIVLLFSEEAANNDSHYSTESAADDELYNSDEEESASNERLLSKILNYNPRFTDEPIIPKLMAQQIQTPVIQPSRTLSADRGLRVIKTINPSPKPNPAVNELAVWVGNMSSQLTDSMLMKRFGKFGKVTSIYRSPNAPYCFVNFQVVGPARKALEEASANGGNIDVGGMLLPVKPSTVKSVKF